MKEITVTTNDLMSVQDAAKKLGRHRYQVYRWIESGKIIGIRLGGILFIPITEIERLQEEWRREAESRQKQNQEAERKKQAEIERLEKELERLKNSQPAEKEVPVKE